MAALANDAGRAAYVPTEVQAPCGPAEGSNVAGIELLSFSPTGSRQHERQSRCLTPHPHRRPQQHATPALPSQPDADFVVLLCGETMHPTPSADHAAPRTNGGLIPNGQQQQQEQLGSQQQQQEQLGSQQPRPQQQQQQQIRGKVLPSPASTAAASPLASGEESEESRPPASCVQLLATQPPAQQQQLRRPGGSRLRPPEGSACKPPQHQHQQHGAPSAAAGEACSPLSGGVLGLGKGLAVAAALLPTLMAKQWHVPAVLQRSSGMGGRQRLPNINLAQQLQQPHLQQQQQQQREGGGKEKLLPLRPLGSSRAIRAVAEASKQRGGSASPSEPPAELPAAAAACAGTAAAPPHEAPGAAAAQGQPARAEPCTATSGGAGEGRPPCGGSPLAPGASRVRACGTGSSAAADGPCEPAGEGSSGISAHEQYRHPSSEPPSSREGSPGGVLQPSRAPPLPQPQQDVRPEWEQGHAHAKAGEGGREALPGQPCVQSSAADSGSSPPVLKERPVMASGRLSAALACLKKADGRQVASQQAEQQWRQQDTGAPNLDGGPTLQPTAAACDALVATHPADILAQETTAGVPGAATAAAAVAPAPSPLRQQPPPEQAPASAALPGLPTGPAAAAQPVAAPGARAPAAAGVAVAAQPSASSHGRELQKHRPKREARSENSASQNPAAKRAKRVTAGPRQLLPTPPAEQQQQLQRPSQLPPWAQHGKAKAANVTPLVCAVAARQPLHAGLPDWLPGGFWGLQQPAAAAAAGGYGGSAGPRRALPGWLAFQDAAFTPAYHACEDPGALHALVAGHAVPVRQVDELPEGAGAPQVPSPSPLGGRSQPAEWALAGPGQEAARAGVVAFASQAKMELPEAFTRLLLTAAPPPKHNQERPTRLAGLMAALRLSPAALKQHLKAALSEERGQLAAFAPAIAAARAGAARSSLAASLLPPRRPGGPGRSRSKPEAGTAVGRKAKPPQPRPSLLGRLAAAAAADGAAEGVANARQVCEMHTAAAPLPKPCPQPVPTQGAGAVDVKSSFTFKIRISGGKACLPLPQSQQQPAAPQAAAAPASQPVPRAAGPAAAAGAAASRGAGQAPPAQHATRGGGTGGTAVAKRLMDSGRLRAPQQSKRQRHEGPAGAGEVGAADGGQGAGRNKTGSLKKLALRKDVRGFHPTVTPPSWIPR